MGGDLSIHIDAPVEKVFALFADPGNWSELSPDDILYDDVRRTPEGVGTTYRWVTRVAGRRVSGTGEFVEFVPDRRITDVSSRSFEGSWTYVFEPEGEGMRLTLHNTQQSFWRIPPLRQLMGWAARRTHADVLVRLKTLMEN